MNIEILCAEFFRLALQHCRQAGGVAALTVWRRAPVSRILHEVLRDMRDIEVQKSMRTRTRWKTKSMVAFQIVTSIIVSLNRYYYYLF